MQAVQRHPFYWDHEKLKTYAEKTASLSGESLADALAKLQQEEQLDSELFFQKVEENLKEGKIRIVFFMEEAPVELKSIVEFLNNQLDRTELLIVEARQFKKDSLRIVAPSLFGYTEQARQMKKVSSIEIVEKRRSWNRHSVLDHITKTAPKELLAPLQTLLAFIDSNRHLLRDDYGTGQNPSIIIRNDNGDSILYIYTSGTIQLPLSQLAKSYDFVSVKSIVEKFSDRLSWKGNIEPTKYPSLAKKLQVLNTEEQKALQQFLLDLVSQQVVGSDE